MGQSNVKKNALKIVVIHLKTTRDEEETRKAALWYVPSVEERRNSSQYREIVTGYNIVYG